MINRRHCYCLNESKHMDFIKWIVELLGPVLLGVKPSEIISFPEKDALSIERREEVKRIFSESTKVDFKEFKASNGCKKILFYHCEALERTLKEYKNTKFLRQYGYPTEYNLHSYLNHMIEKIEKRGIPHEIGIFLGYPLKDVIGFMGHPSLKLTKINGWRVYGNPRLSDEKFVRISEAKKQIKHLLQTTGLEGIMQSA
ncbi:MAG: DUF3793 family protein [Clostridiaceae bacterium]|nr:DUF3793 family protein [Clostridiaceae bacterium]